MNVLGEYWLGGHRPAVVSIFETDYEPIMELGLNWGDVFDIALRARMHARARSRPADFFRLCRCLRYADLDVQVLADEVFVPFESA